MIKGLVTTIGEPLPIVPAQKKLYGVVAAYVIIQCVFAIAGCTSILMCMWSPEGVKSDFEKLSRIMYLYDPRACGHSQKQVGLITSVVLDSDPKDAHVRRIPWKPPEVTSSTRLSTKTRMYVAISVSFHTIWIITAIGLIICKYLTPGLIAIHKIILAIFFYYTVCMIIFDVSMAVVYIADMQQSLTKGMVLRYSGWGVDIKLSSTDDFAGWLPMIASFSWMRGILFLALNVYFCKRINYYRTKLKLREVKIKLKVEGNLAFPDSGPSHRPLSHYEDGTLHYRTGEMVFLSAFTLGAISIQALISIVVSWLILGCKLGPFTEELHELTLMKLLYLYDPGSCSRIFLYNYTTQVQEKHYLTSVMSPMRNHVAASFRRRIHLWLVTHLFWAIFGIAYMAQGRRACAFYATLIPFTFSGICVLLLEFVLTIFFLNDIKYTATEKDILEYINYDLSAIRWVNMTASLPNQEMMPEPMDTTWVPLLFAFASCGGVVQWVVNFWIVKDNYVEGVATYRRLQAEKPEKLKKQLEKQASYLQTV